MNLTIAICTSRLEPHLDWFCDAVRKHFNYGEKPQLIVVDFWSQIMPMNNWGESDVAVRRVELLNEIGPGFDVLLTPPKPTVFQGPHRLTQSDFWAKSNALNTAICLARHEWFAAVDDRALPVPTWLNSIRLAMKGKYAVCGAYEKRLNVKVIDGRMANSGEMDGADKNSISGRDRELKAPTKLIKTTGAWWYGCTNALPLEWALQVNGYEENLDSLKMEDTQFGSMLEANGYPIRYDPRMKVILDRTRTALESDMRSDCKERHPHDEQDKGHAAIRKFWGIKWAKHQWDLRDIRDRLQRGEPWPVPTGPTTDWFDGQELKDMK